MNHYYYDTISQLRSNEEIILFDKIIDFNSEDELLLKNLLQIEWENESLSYPYSVPEFDEQAAIWAAKVIYISCQLIIYREHKADEIISLFPVFAYEINSSSILSADLCLRFLPQVVNEAKKIDPDDRLIPILEDILTKWHFSSIGASVFNDNLDFKVIFENRCLEQLYIDRIIEKKDIKRAFLPELNKKVKAILGDHATTYWKEIINQ